jgi:ferredoxin
MTLRIEIDPEKCMGSGNCSFWAPATFDLGDDGVAYVVDAEGDPEDKVLLAAQGCPTQAISVWRDDDRIA